MLEANTKTAQSEEAIKIHKLTSQFSNLFPESIKFRQTTGSHLNQYCVISRSSCSARPQTIQA
jgi:hypothetical protein